MCGGPFSQVLHNQTRNQSRAVHAVLGQDCERPWASFPAEGKLVLAIRVGVNGEESISSIHHVLVCVGLTCQLV